MKSLCLGVALFSSLGSGTACLEIQGWLLRCTRLLGLRVKRFWTNAPPPNEINTGALIIRIGFWGPLYDNYNKEPPQNSIGIYLGPYCVHIHIHRPAHMASPIKSLSSKQHPKGPEDPIIRYLGLR